MKPKFLIWSLEHRSWWAPNSHGYTPVRAEAGRYTYEDALEIVTGANQHSVRQTPHEAMCPEWPAPIPIDTNHEEA